MKNYKTLTEWLLDICNSINNLIDRVNTIYSVPAGGTKGQVLTKSGPENYDLEWKDQEAEAANGIPGGGTTGQILAKKSNADYDAEWIDNQGGAGDVTAEGDNVFSGKNTFVRPIIIGEGSAPDNAARVSQVTELGDEVNAIAGASVTKDNVQTITGAKTFTVSPKVPAPTSQADATPKSYVDTEIDTAASETLTEAKAYTDGSEDRIKDAVIVDVEQADNVFTGNNTFDKPISVGAPIGENDATTKKYVDDIKTETATNITQLTENQTALQEDVQELQNGVINALTTTGTAGQVWTKNSGYGEWKDPTGGGSGSDDIWRPTVSEEGEISWEKSTSSTPPATQNIRGPKGEQGDKGGTGDTGPQGPAGEGVPAGGTTGQVLAKKSATDYDTEWVDQQGGSTPSFQVTTLSSLNYMYMTLYIGNSIIGRTYNDAVQFHNAIFTYDGSSKYRMYRAPYGGGTTANQTLSTTTTPTGYADVILLFSIQNLGAVDCFVPGEASVYIGYDDDTHDEFVLAGSSQNAQYKITAGHIALYASSLFRTAKTITSFTVTLKDVFLYV